jgi:hypothetical protein
METYSQVLDKVNKNKGDGLAFLKGRMEQVREAMTAGIILKKKYTGMYCILQLESVP